METKVVLMTGCSTGFGRELVPRFLSRGWTVVATLRNLKDRKELFAQELREYPDRLHLLSLDVGNEGERNAAVEFVGTRGGRLDALINNAGYGQFGALEDISESQLRQQFEVNFFGAVFLTRALLPLLRQSKGRVINISSVAGTMGLPLSSAYCSSKFALEGLSESLYFEVRPFGVQVCLVEPGRHRTEFSRHMVWGEKSRERRSIYSRMTENYLNRKDKLSERVVIPQENVIRVVLKLAEARSMPLRVPVGTDAWAARLVKTLLPERLQTALMRVVWKKALGS
jgi:NAD(P)-dependent dehydrogenase (short-subunit alcohol dehydrogenase family)